MGDDCKMNKQKTIDEISKCNIEIDKINDLIKKVNNLPDGQEKTNLGMILHYVYTRQIMIKGVLEESLKEES